MPTAQATATASSGGLGFLGALTLLLAAGKIFADQTYSWWLVFAPIWGPIVLFAVGAILYIIIGTFLDMRKDKKRRKRLEARRASKALNDYSKSIR